MVEPCSRVGKGGSGIRRISSMVVVVGFFVENGSGSFG